MGYLKTLTAIALAFFFSANRCHDPVARTAPLFGLSGPRIPWNSWLFDKFARFG